MTHCIHCGGFLPKECTCKVSDRTKALRWLECCMREVKVVYMGYKRIKPSILIDGVQVPKSRITLHPNYRNATLDVVIKLLRREHNAKRIILLDVNGMPLYGRDMQSILPKDFRSAALEIVWQLGRMSEEEMAIRSRL